VVAFLLVITVEKLPGNLDLLVEMERPERWCDVRSADSSLTALGLQVHGAYSEDAFILLEDGLPHKQQGE
jgi:hypothetical protein